MIIACVRTGSKYSFDYVERLRNMVERHLVGQFRMVCLTDQPERCEGVEFWDITSIGLPGWWAKMILFQGEWRQMHRVVFLDLDTVVIGNLAPLCAVALGYNGFGICENFTRLAGNTGWPCKYNSSVMVLDSSLDDGVWRVFNARRSLIERHNRYGDQMAIEELRPNATLLQRVLPVGYFHNYRNLTMTAPPNAAIVNFGGRHKPANCDIPWVRQAWA